MNSLEQATKAIFDELHNDGCPFEDSERLAIIAKHMDAFAREQNEKNRETIRVITRLHDDEEKENQELHDERAKGRGE